MPNLINNPGNVSNALAQNYRRTQETTRFGTHKLAFYTFTTGSLDIVTNWEQPNSLYSQIVRGLQAAGVELFWLGQPHSSNEEFWNNWSGLIPSNTQNFTFAIRDDSDSASKYLEGRNTFDVLGANQDGYNNYLKIDYDIDYDGPIFLRGQPVTFNMTDDGVTQGVTYYLEDIEYNGNYTYIRLSLSVTQQNNDNTPDYPTGVGHPGPVFDLDPAPSGNTYTARFDFNDTYWQGTAGDFQSSCCWDPDFKTIYATRLQSILNPIISTSNYNILRCQDTFGIFPLTCLF